MTTAIFHISALQNQRLRGEQLNMKHQLSTLFEIQQKLDEHIEEQHPIQEGEDRLSKRILAFQTELGELANELPEVFKFWSNKRNNKERALKEFVDGVHFLLSIGLSEISLCDMLLPIGYSYSDTGTITEETIEEQFLSIYLEASILSDAATFNIYSFNTVEEAYDNLVRRFLGLGEMLGFTWEDIKSAYLHKNQINHHRQDRGY